MSVTTDHLALFGVTLQEAHDFVFEHLDNPAMVLATAAQFGVTTAMLGEIAGGLSAATVLGFFADHGLDGSTLDDALTTPGGYYMSAPADPAALVGMAPMTYDLMGG